MAKICRYCEWPLDENGNLIRTPKYIYKKGFDLPFSYETFDIGLHITPDDGMYISVGEWEKAVKINYCPMCGRKL